MCNLDLRWKPRGRQKRRPQPSVAAAETPVQPQVRLTGLVCFPIGAALKELIAGPSGGNLDTPHWSSQGVNGYRCGHRFGDLLFREFVSTPRPRPSLIRFFAPYCNLMPRHGSNRRRGPYRTGTDGHSEKNMNAPRKSRWRGPALAFLLLRLTLGLNICMHGVSRIAAGPATFADSIVPMFLNTPLPAWSVHVFGLMLPWAEAILGFLLLLGFCTRFALVAGSLLILVLTFGATLRQDWSTAGVQLVYTAVYASLLALERWNDYSLDRLLSLRHPSMRSFGK